MQAALSLLGLVSSILAVVVMTRVAPKRGRRAWPWAILAVCFGWLAFIPLFIAPNRS